MTDEEKLRAEIAASGMRISEICGKIGLTRQGFYYKLHGKNEFKASEIKALADLLHLSGEKVNSIFFAPYVAETATISNCD